jgi:hypothetical protein
MENGFDRLLGLDDYGIKNGDEIPCYGKNVPILPGNIDLLCNILEGVYPNPTSI